MFIIFWAGLGGVNEEKKVVGDGRQTAFWDTGWGNSKDERNRGKMQNGCRGKKTAYRGGTRKN